MTKQEVVTKIQHGLKINSELQDLEFKTAKSSIPTDIWKSISAFGNRRGGGIIAFGINENKNKVTGCENMQKMQTILGEIFTDKMSFQLRPEYFVLFEGPISYLTVFVPACPKDYMPYYYKPAGLPNGAYIRDGISNRKITDSEFRTYVATSREFQFDRSEARGSNLLELDFDKIKQLLIDSDITYGRGANSEVTDTVLNNLGITVAFDSKQVPTVGGYLIFAKNIPQQLNSFDRYLVRCIRYAGSDVTTDILDSKDISGTIDVQIDEAYKFVLKNIKKNSIIVGTKRIARYEYPEKAVRELIANSLIHRDYRITETYVQIRIFEDRVEILNPGTLPPGVTVENIRDSQFSRNAMIASRMKDLHYLEEYGRGIDIVFNAMKDYKLKDPIFRNLVNSFEVILLGEKYSKLNERQMKILNLLLLKGQITVQDCENYLLDVPRGTINADLRKLKDEMLIRSNGASSTTFYTFAI